MRQYLEIPVRLPPAMVALVLACGCSSGSGSGGACTKGACDASTSGTADAGPLGDASWATFEVDAGVCGSGSGPTCNSLSSSGSAVAPTCSTGAAPTMTGGTISDATYVLKSAALYASSCTSATTGKLGPAKVTFSAGCIQSIDAQGGSESAAWAVDASTLALRRVCPSPQDTTVEYTAAGTTLSEALPYLSGGTLVMTYEQE